MMSQVPTKATLLLALVPLTLALVAACGAAPRYDYSPDPSWKPRLGYCYEIVLDPQGDENTRWAWADEADSELGPDGATVRASNVRVAPKPGTLRDANDPNHDYFSRIIIWTIKDGSLTIDRRCP